VEPLPSDALKQAHIDAVGMPGQLLCFLRLFDGEPVFGILANDVDDARLFGTCILLNGEYQTLSCHLLGQAASRCKERKYMEICPRVELLSILLERNKNIRDLKHDIQMVESDYKIALRKAAKKRREEQQKLDATAHMRAASPTSPLPNDSQKIPQGDAVEPLQDKQIAPIPYSLDALHKGPTESVPTVDSDCNADTRESPIASDSNADTQMREARSITTTQSDNQTSQLVEPVATRPDKGNEPDALGIDTLLQCSHTMTLVNESTNLQHLAEGHKQSTPTDDPANNVDTRKSPVPAMTVRHESTLTKSDLYNKTFQGDANTLLLLLQTATHTHAPADSVDPVPATTTSSPITETQSEPYAEIESGMVAIQGDEIEDTNVDPGPGGNDSGADEIQGDDIEENNLDPGPGGKQLERPLSQGEKRGETTIESTAAKVDALAESVMAMARQLALLVQPNNEVQRSTVRMKTEYIKPENIEVTEVLSSDEDTLEGNASRRSTDTIEHAHKFRTNVETFSSSVSKTTFGQNDSANDDETSTSETTKTKRPRTKSSKQPIRTPRYTQAQQKRELSKKNWLSGVSRHSTSKRIETDIAAATVPSMSMVPATLRVLGFAIIRNFKKVQNDNLNALYDSGSDDNASGSVPIVKAVFSEGNGPSAEQAAFYNTPGWSTTGTSNKPKSEPIFEGVTITSNSYAVGPAKVKQSNHTEPCPRTGRLPRQAMKANSKALQVYNEKYKGQMEDIIRGMFGNSQRKGRQDPAGDPNNWHLSQNIVWGGTEINIPIAIKEKRVHSITMTFFLLCAFTGLV
jgi:hypothetical protein